MTRTCSESGFTFSVTVWYHETRNGRNWRVTHIYFKVFGDPSRKENNGDVTFGDGSGLVYNHERDDMTANGNQYLHEPNGLKLPKSTANFQIHGQFDVPRAPDPECFGGFYYM